MDTGGSGPTTAFISYSHDSPSHSERVLRLSDRLRSEGVDCQVDQYEMAPPEGWPTWMDRMIRDSDFVLVVCTEPYHRRVSGREEEGIGLGAKWEGAIISQDIYEAEGRNEKFLPVVFEPEDLRHRPRYLRATTYYDLRAEDGYEQLYRRLTSQPKAVPPGLGNVRTLDSDRGPLESPVASSPRDLVLLSAERPKGLIVYEADAICAGEILSVTLVPINPTDASLLRELKGRPSSRVGVAYGNDALLGKIQRIEQIVANGRDTWRVEIMPEESDYGAGMMEMGTTSYSADDLAEMRARRILLNESLEQTPFGSRGQADRAFMDVLIRGHSTPIQVTESPLPALWQGLQDDRSTFLAVARLVSVMWLKLSGVVAHIHRLELGMASAGQLSVDFEGPRPRKYTNVDPPIVRVAGVCHLSRRRCELTEQGTWINGA